jgi:hypothetical protein
MSRRQAHYLLLPVLMSSLPHSLFLAVNRVRVTFRDDIDNEAIGTGTGFWTHVRSATVPKTSEELDGRRAAETKYSRRCDIFL